MHTHLWQGVRLSMGSSSFSPSFESLIVIVVVWQSRDLADHHDPSTSWRRRRRKKGKTHWPTTTSSCGWIQHIRQIGQLERNDDNDLFTLLFFSSSLPLGLVAIIFVLCGLTQFCCIFSAAWRSFSEDPQCETGQRGIVPLILSHFSLSTIAQGFNRHQMAGRKEIEQDGSMTFFHSLFMPQECVVRNKRRGFLQYL